MSAAKPVIDPPAANELPANPLALTILGWIMSVVAAAAIGLAAGMLVAKPQFMIDEWVKNYPDWSMLPVGAVTVLAAVLYLVPQTSTLGAILLPGYLGGAVATHTHQAEAFGWIGAVIAAALIWLGLVLRDPLVRRVLPIRW